MSGVGILQTAATVANTAAAAISAHRTTIAGTGRKYARIRVRRKGIPQPEEKREDASDTCNEPSESMELILGLPDKHDPLVCQHCAHPAPCQSS